MWTSLAQAVRWPPIELKAMAEEYKHPVLPLGVAAAVLQRILEAILAEWSEPSVLVSDRLLLSAVAKVLLRRNRVLVAMVAMAALSLIRQVLQLVAQVVPM